MTITCQRFAQDNDHRMNIRSLTSYLHTADILFMSFGALLSLMNLLFFWRIPHWWLLILINIAVAGAILTLAYFRHTTGWRVLRYVHDWYAAPTVFFTFKEIYFMLGPIHQGRDYDDVLIAIDRWIFTVNPTEWLMRFSYPALTELLQIAYTSFYFLFLVVGFELYRRRNPDLFHYFMFTCLYGFFLSYIGYFLLPAVGPRFTLHDFSALDKDLPGLWLTPYLRWFVNAGESIPMGVPNAVAIAGTQRAVFPSGHTMMTLVLIYLCAKHGLRVRWIVYIAGALLIVATVYQRYHYVIDLVGGALFMILCVRTAPWLYARAKSAFNTLESRLPPSIPGT
jgi:membrane-associated phospholipid phosphatase